MLAPPDKGGDWLEVRFEDGTHWRYRPEELKRPKGASRIFDTERYAFTKSAPPLWRRVWEEWSAENAVGQLMGTLRMYAERQLEPQCWADEEGLLGVLLDVWLEEGVYGRLGRYTRERLRLAWRLTREAAKLPLLAGLPGMVKSAEEYETQAVERSLPKTGRR